MKFRLVEKVEDTDTIEKEDSTNLNSQEKTSSDKRGNQTNSEVNGTPTNTTKKEDDIESIIIDVQKQTNAKFIET